MLEHLAMTLVPLGVAVLSYERRPPAKHADTELSVQASDAIASMRALQHGLEVPVGLFGFSQGAVGRDRGGERWPRLFPHGGRLLGSLSC